MGIKAMAPSPTKSNGKPKVAENHILLSREELESVAPTLITMGFGKVVQLLWWVTKETGFREIAATFCEEIAAVNASTRTESEGQNASTGTEEEKPVERYEWQRWTKTNFEQMFGLCSTGLTLQDSPKIAREEYEKYFSKAYDKNNMWDLGCCKDPDLTKIFKFIVPLVTPDRGTKKRIPFKVAHLVISCWKDEEIVDWCEILHEQFQEMCTKTVLGKYYVTPWLFGIYSHWNELNEAEQGEYDRYLSKYGVGVETPLMTGTQGAMNGGKNAPVDDSGIPCRTNTGVPTNVMANVEMGSDFDRKHSPDADVGAAAAVVTVNEAAEDVTVTQDVMNGEAEGDEYDRYVPRYGVGVETPLMIGAQHATNEQMDAAVDDSDIPYRMDTDVAKDGITNAAVDDSDMPRPMDTDVAMDGITNATAEAEVWSLEMMRGLSRLAKDELRFAPWTNKWFAQEDLSHSKNCLLSIVSRRLSQLFSGEEPKWLIGQLQLPGLSPSRLLRLFNTDSFFCDIHDWGTANEYSLILLAVRGTSQAWMDVRTPKLNDQSAADCRLLQKWFGSAEGTYSKLYPQELQYLKQYRAEIMLLKAMDYDGMISKDVDPSIRQSDTNWGMNNDAPEVPMRPAPLANGAISQNLHDEEAFEYDEFVAQSPSKFARVEEYGEHSVFAPGPSGWEDNAQSARRINRTSLQPAPLGDDERSKGSSGEEALQNHSDEGQPLRDYRSRSDMFEDSEEAFSSFINQKWPGLTELVGPSSMRSDNRFVDGDRWSMPDIPDIRPTASDVDNGCLNPDVSATPPSVSPRTHPEVSTSPAEVYVDDLDEPPPTAPSPINAHNHWVSSTSKLSDDMKMKRNECRSLMAIEGEELAKVTSKVKATSERLEKSHEKHKSTLGKSHEKHKATDGLDRFFVLVSMISQMLVGIDAGVKLQGIVEEMKQIFNQCWTISWSLLADMQTIAAELKRFAQDYEERGRSFLEGFDNCTSSLCHLVQAFIGKEESNFLSIATFPNWIAPVA